LSIDLRMCDAPARADNTKEPCIIDKHG
jgi:hypothetical protein